MKIEYKVRPVTRYVVTRFHQEEVPNSTMVHGGSDTKGEFDNFDIAYAVAYALAKEEHDRLGWLPGDERIQYPGIPEGVEVPPK
jgi:hypothetical protein